MCNTISSAYKDSLISFSICNPLMSSGFIGFRVLLLFGWIFSLIIW